MRGILFIIAVGVSACASSQPLYSTSVGGWPISTWQARHGNVLKIECTPPMPPLETFDFELSHGRLNRIVVDPRHRPGLVARHCKTTVARDNAPGAPQPPVALVYTPSAEQLWAYYGSHAAADRAFGHHVHSGHESPYRPHH